ncbi:MAG: sodium-translocating pyrophosphatase [Verrucomicrobiota bacterium]
MKKHQMFCGQRIVLIVGLIVCGLAAALPAVAADVAPRAHLGGEANLVLPRLDDTGLASFGGLSGHNLLLGGLLICLLGLGFGLVVFAQMRRRPVHRAMLEISELIYETCKTYLITQGKFLGILWVLIGVIIVAYFGFIQHMEIYKVGTILAFSVLGIAGSFGVAWFGIRMNTFANSRTAFASLAGKGYPCYAIPLQAGMSIGMLLISVELFMMLAILLFVPGDLAGACFIGFAIGESLGASALRIAGGIFTKIADIGSDLMKIVFKIKEDDARNPGVIADCTGDNAGDSVGPTADGFETYGVTGVALITFIMLAVPAAAVQVQLLVWIFAMRVLMVVTSAGSYFVNELIMKARYGAARKFNFEHPLTSLVWITSAISVVVTYVSSALLIPHLGDGTLWWKLASIITCGTLAGAVIPEVVKVFTSVNSRHVREVVNSSREGGASLNILSGLTAGNFSGYWLGMTIVALMSVAYIVSRGVAPEIMQAPAVFAFGLVAFGFLGMGPVTIAVDSYGPVTDNAQSVYELSMIETLPYVSDEIQKDFGFKPDFTLAKELLEENDGAGNTFKATAKPVLIGTAVVGATTMIFSIIMSLTNGLTEHMTSLSLMHPPFLLGLVSGGAIIYWFSGASTQAVVAGAYAAVEFIKANIKLGSTEKASIEDSKRVVEICTLYAQKGMWNIFLAVFFTTLAFACVEPFFFIGYLISIALFGLYQAIFMANAGGAWDNAKKIVETEMHAKGTDLHDACVVGDTVGDPFKDTSSVAMNPIIKFTTLFGLLAVEMAVGLVAGGRAGLTHVLAGVFYVVSVVFVYRSFYSMRIQSKQKLEA